MDNVAYRESIVFATMDPNLQPTTLYPRVPPPKDVDPPRQRIDVAVPSSPPFPFPRPPPPPLGSVICGLTWGSSVNVVGDGKSNVPDGQKINLVV